MPQLLWRTDGLGRLLAEAEGCSLSVQLAPGGAGARFTVLGPGRDRRPILACGLRASCRKAMMAAELAATARADAPALRLPALSLIAGSPRPPSTAAHGRAPSSADATAAQRHEAGGPAAPPSLAARGGWHAPASGAER
jgi:hypothetical protein